MSALPWDPFSILELCLFPSTLGGPRLTSPSPVLTKESLVAGQGDSFLLRPPRGGHVTA